MKDNKVLTIGIIVAVVLVCAAIVLSCIALCGGERKKTASDGNGTTTYSISFDSESGSEVQNIVSESGKPITEPIPEKEGMIFDGWYTSNDGGITLDEKFDFGYMPEGDVQLYAKWKEPTVKNGIYTYKGYEIVWTEEEKQTILAERNQTEEEFYKFLEENLPYYDDSGRHMCIWFDSFVDGSVYLIGFADDANEVPIAYYKVDSENVLHFYATAEDRDGGINEMKADADYFFADYTVSADCKTIRCSLKPSIEDSLKPVVLIFELSAVVDD
ncbi:MAG: InlB B-repeat-containing protein [Christensenellaceae bacterium]|nr:InlB B-repeat-containing protein [Christensenellaceae bacterium]